MITWCRVTALLLLIVIGRLAWMYDELKDEHEIVKSMHSQQVEMTNNIGSELSSCRGGR